ERSRANGKSPRRRSRRRRTRALDAAHGRCGKNVLLATAGAVIPSDRSQPRWGRTGRDFLSAGLLVGPDYSSPDPRVRRRNHRSIWVLDWVRSAARAGEGLAAPRSRDGTVRPEGASDALTPRLPASTVLGEPGTERFYDGEEHLRRQPHVGHHGRRPPGPV